MSGGVDRLALFGTEEPLPARRTLRAGPLGAILEEGNLRTIRYGGVEVVRAINYLARDSAWGTYKAELSNLAIEESDGAFSVTYDGLCSGPEGRFAYRMKISGEASGRLVMEAAGEALTDFPTNRTGFVVLHPSEAAGGRLAIRHSDGRVEETAFPEAISPDQPAFDIAALTHEPAPGLTCTVTMEGDAFEMEDQRNWADASFKTYVRPLSRPRPYTIARGAHDVQKISIAIEGRPPTASATAAGSAVLTIGKVAGRMPSLALFADPDELATAIANAAALGPAQSLVVRFDPARGHGGGTLAEAARLAASIGATLSVEAVFDTRDPPAEASDLAAAVEASGVRPEAVLVSPRREFRTRPSGTLPEGEHAIADVVAAVKAGGIGARIGAGTPSFFTEFNRNPPVGDSDFVFFSIAANVHAADDVSIMETLGVHPAIVASARKLCPGRPIWLGPCTIAVRHNAYGASVVPNPELLRKPAAGVDPRHGALFGAAFATGVAARAAEAGVERLILASPTGAHGLLDANGRPRPMQRVHAILAAAAGAPRYEVATGNPDLAALAFDDAGGRRVLAANLGSEAIRLELHAAPLSVEVVGGGDARADGDRILLPPYRTLVATLPDAT